MNGCFVMQSLTISNL